MKREPQKLECEIRVSDEVITPEEAKIRMAKFVCMLYELGKKYQHIDTESKMKNDQNK